MSLHLFTKKIILESLAGFLMELCESDFFLIFSSFQFPLIFQLRYQFPVFFQAAFRVYEKASAQTFLEELIKFRGVSLSNYKYFSSLSSCLLLLLEVCKDHYKKDTSVGGSDQRRYALFKIYLRKTWLNLFGLILAALSFSTFMFSIGIKLFIRHPVLSFRILILLEQVNYFVQLPPWCILKDRAAMSSQILEILSSMSHYCSGKTNEDTRYDIDQNQAALVNGSC